MDWTREAPTEPGWYWHRNEGGEDSVAQVYDEDYKTGPARLRVEFIGYDVPSRIEDVGGEWSGPIPAPGAESEVEPDKPLSNPDCPHRGICPKHDGLANHTKRLAALAERVDRLQSVVEDLNSRPNENTRDLKALAGEFIGFVDRAAGDWPRCDAARRIAEE